MGAPGRVALRGAARAAPPAGARGVEAERPGERVVIVDDVESFRGLARERLESDGFQILARRPMAFPRWPGRRG
jgi:hypothetical protein